MTNRSDNPSGGRVPPTGRGQPRLLGPWAAAVILIGFWVFLQASLRDKSLTFDEVASATAGCSYWRFGDFRLQPENGHLPQLVAGLPLALGPETFPSTDSENWRNANVLFLGFDWFYQLGNDAAAMGARGRAVCGLLAVALGALVWSWSRQLSGPVGGMISLLLYVFSPTVLANGALMTSDMAVALFFFAALASLSALGQCLTIGRVLGSGLLLGALAVSKMSAVLIVPVALLLAIIRVADGRPLRLEIGRPWEITRRAWQTIALALVALAQIAVVVAVVWAAYGFRYAAFSNSDKTPGRFTLPWAYVLSQPIPGVLLQKLDLSREQQERALLELREHAVLTNYWTNNAADAMDAISRTVLTAGQRQKLEALLAEPPTIFSARVPDFLRRHQLLPEAWVYALADVLRRSQWRSAFLNGDYSMVGWAGFFPYTFLVKTPLVVFGVMGLALAAVVVRRRSSVGSSLGVGAYEGTPLWVFLAVYWAVAVASHLNIGHRHLLPVYAPLFVLCGAAGWWIEARLKMAGYVLLGLLGVLAGEVWWRYPNYLAYFNGIVGPRQAYRHLIDSSLDWGQDLPAVRRYIEAHPTTGPYYFSYFGMADPAYYGITARPLYSFLGVHLARRPSLAILPLTSDQVESALAGLQSQRPEYDLLSVNQVAQEVVSIWLKKPAELRLAAGTYLISASMMQPVYYELTGPWGPWNERHEAVYQQLYADVKPLLGDAGAARMAALNRHLPGEWPGLLQQFDIYRLARLTAWLRQREPDETINYSVLVFHLTGADLRRALDGPPPEPGPDRAKEMLERQAGP
jgi:hypothetical protein